MNAGSLFVLALAVAAALVQFSLHKIDEGYVGVYYRGGALINRVTQPGYHLKIPFLDVSEQVQITLQTDKVTDIPCGTSGGVLISIDRVEVVNRLKDEHVYMTIKNYTVHYDKIWIFDKIHHEINQFCSKHTLQEVYIDLFHTVDDRLQQALQESCDKWAPGIEIIAIRITKPRIPEHILRNYEAMEAEKTKLLVAVQAQKVAEKEAETEKKRATIEAEKVAAVSKIKMEQQVDEKEAEKRMKALEDDALLNHERTIADGEFYRRSKIAEGNALTLTENYLRLELIKSLGNNTKVYFGPSIENIYLDLLDSLSKNKISSPHN